MIQHPVYCAVKGALEIDGKEVVIAPIIALSPIMREGRDVPEEFGRWVAKAPDRLTGYLLEFPQWWPNDRLASKLRKADDVVVRWQANMTQLVQFHLEHVSFTVVDIRHNGKLVSRHVSALASRGPSRSEPLQAQDGEDGVIGGWWYV